MSSAVEFRPFSVNISANARDGIAGFWLKLEDESGVKSYVTETGPGGKKWGRSIFAQDYKGFLLGAILYTCPDPIFHGMNAKTFQLQQFKPDDPNVEEYRLNLFVINKATRCGVYQACRSTTGISEFKTFLRDKWDEYRSQMRANWLIEDATRDPDDAVKAVPPGRFSIRPRMGHHDFAEAVGKLSSISLYRYNVDLVGSTAPNPYSAGIPGGSATKGEIKFPSSTRSTINKIVSLVRSIAHKKAKVIGIDADGVERILQITDFHEIDMKLSFDEWSRRLPGKMEDIAASRAMKTLISRFSDRSDLYTPLSAEEG